VARRTREHRGPRRRHDGTVDTPAANSEPPNNCNINRGKSPTPAPETCTRAESTPPPPTPSDSAITSPAPTLSISYDTTNSHPPHQIAAGGSRDTHPPNATNATHAPSPKPHNKPEPPMHQQKKNVRPGCTQCSLCVQRSRRIERKLGFWVFCLLLGASGQGSMPPGCTRREPRTQKVPDAERVSRGNKLLRMQPHRILE